MAEEKIEKPDEGEEAWITVQLVAPPPGGYFAAFIVEAPELKVQTRAVSWFALQHLAFEEDGHEELESRIVPVVVEPGGETLFLDGGRSGGPDHGFAGVANSAGEAETIGRAVLAELVKAREASK